MYYRVVFSWSATGAAIKGVCILYYHCSSKPTPVADFQTAFLDDPPPTIHSSKSSFRILSIESRDGPVIVITSHHITTQIFINDGNTLPPFYGISKKMKAYTCLKLICDLDT